MLHISTLRARVAAGLLAAAMAVASPAVRAADQRPISEFDLFRFTWIADPQMSPDGAQVAFVRVDVNAKKDGYDTSLWIVPAAGGSEPRKLTAGPRDSSPRWSPDGKSLAFVRALEEGGRPQPGQVFVLSMNGGEARQVTKLARGAGNPIWSPDGKTIAFTNTSSPKDQEKPAAPPSGGDTSDPAAEQARRTSDVRVITRAVYRANGGGYLDPTRKTGIWTIAVDEALNGNGSASGGGSGKPSKVTDSEFDANLAGWSADGREIYVIANRVAEPYYEAQDTDLYRVSATARDTAPTRMISIDGSIGAIELSPDGKSVAFGGSLNTKPVRSYNQPDLFVAAVSDGAAATNLSDKFDFDIGGAITGDQRAPRGGFRAAPVWLDAHRIATIAAHEGRADIFVFDAKTGASKPLTNGNHEVMAFTTSNDGSKMVALLSTTTMMGELFAIDPATGKTGAQLTDFNKKLFSELRLTPAEEISYPSFDGKKIQAWVQKPPDFDPSKKYPLILNIHGGPHAAYGFTFFHEMQWMAAKGYVVLYPNPRGSTSYGQDFGNVIQHRYPGDDHKDLMAGVDFLIAKGYIDSTRLGVTGGSGGGLLTNWAVTQTDRFAAAVSQRSIADWAGFWYTADFTLFTPSWFKAAPWEDPKDFAARSPLTFVSKIKTPIMFIEGEIDLRTPPSDGGEQLFRALKYLKRPTAMVQFPGESHELSRSGQPWHRVERLQHIMGWFDKYLQGKDPGTYATR